MKRLLYVELKSGHDLHRGPAWIALVGLSKSGQTVYFRGRALRRANVGFAANHIDAESRHVYWISGVKKDGQDRHWGGAGPVHIESGAVAPYLAQTDRRELPRNFALIDDFQETSVAPLS